MKPQYNHNGATAGLRLPLPFGCLLTPEVPENRWRSAQQSNDPVGRCGAIRAGEGARPDERQLNVGR